MTPPWPMDHRRSGVSASAMKTAENESLAATPLNASLRGLLGILLGKSPIIISS